MKVLTRVFHLEDEYDSRSGFQLIINGQKWLEFLEGEPEDANLSRDFSDVYKIPEVLTEVSGEQVMIDREEIYTWEEWDRY